MHIQWLYVAVVCKSEFSNVPISLAIYLLYRIAEKIVREKVW